MAQYFSVPYPARAALGIKELPRGAQVEMDGVLVKRSMVSCTKISSPMRA
jgi:enamine deaminase RidA (YjgF/YER057c/UK114 family)